MHKEGFYSSGEFAKKANVTVRTIRFYDKKNLLKPSYVNENGARFYTDADFARLQQILLFKYLGFSLDDIKNITVGDSDYNILINSLHLQLNLIKDKIAQMQLVKKCNRRYGKNIKGQRIHRLEQHAFFNTSYQHGKQS